MSVSPTDGNGPTQGQRKILTRVGIEPIYLKIDHLSEMDMNIGLRTQMYFQQSSRPPSFPNKMKRRRSYFGGGGERQLPEICLHSQASWTWWLMLIKLRGSSVQTNCCARDYSQRIKIQDITYYLTI